MSIRLKKFSYRYAEEVFNGKLVVKNEVEDILYAATKDLSILSRPEFNRLLNDEFARRGWICQPQVFDSEDDAYARFGFMKDRIGVEVQFGHSSFIGIDLLKFQVASYSKFRFHRFWNLYHNDKGFSEILKKYIWTEVGRLADI